MNIIIGADIVPTQSNIDSFLNGNIRKLIDENLEKKLQQADFRIFNLEVPLTDAETPIKKWGPGIIAPTGTVLGMKKLGVDLFTLANNHIMDQGMQGLESTFKVLKESNINYIGAGENITEAKHSYVIEKDGVKIGIYACAEHEFSIAEENAPGANPFDPLESPDHVAELKSECDYVMVLYHGGKEHYRYPSPNLQKVCRKMCDKGADLVVCQHSHCIGCEEKYNNSTIVYGQGNFIFDMRSNEYWNSSVLLSVDFNDTMNIEYIPVEKAGGLIKISADDNILKEFKERSVQIENPKFIEEKYSEFAQLMLQGYLRIFCGTSLPYRILNKLCGHRLKKKISEKRKLAMRNYIECEAHRELILDGLKQMGNE